MPGAQEGLETLIASEALVTFVTSRHDVLRWPTRRWLSRLFPSLEGHGYGLLMHPQGDYRTPQSLRLDQLAEIQKGLGSNLWYIDDFPVQVLVRTFKAPEDWPTVVALCRGEV